MTRLLVSVRNRSEALAALEAGADLLDIKEPRHGSLGYAGAEAIIDITRAIAGRAPVSAAFGELATWTGAGDAASGLEACQLAFAKVGLAHCASLPDWKQRWLKFHLQLPSRVHRVAVVYADEAAQSPALGAILAHAAYLNCRAVLIDTFDKRGGSLLGHWSLARIESSIRTIQAQGMLAVLAGGLTESAIQTLLPLAPDILAVRGAACAAGQRTHTICRQRMERLRAMIHGGG